MEILPGIKKKKQNNNTRWTDHNFIGDILSYNYYKKLLKVIVIHKVQIANFCSMITVWMNYILCPLKTAAACDGKYFIVHQIIFVILSTWF